MKTPLFLKSSLQHSLRKTFVQYRTLCRYGNDDDNDVTCIIILFHVAPEHRLTPFTPQVRLTTGGGHAHSHLELVQTLGVGKWHVKGVIHAFTGTLSNNNKQESVILFI